MSDPPQRVRVRKLKHHSLSSGEVVGGAANLMAGHSRAADPAASVIDLEVRGEAMTTLAEAQAMVARGDLVPEDLVDLGDGWQSIEDATPFDDVVQPYRTRRKVIYLLQVAAVAAAIVAYFAFRAMH